MKRNTSVFGALFAVFCSIALLAQTPAKDPRIGNWKFNLSKSTYPAGTTAPQMSLRSYTARPDGFSVNTNATINAQGNAAFNLTAYKLDGNAYPTYNQINLAELSVAGKKPDTATYKLLDPNTVEFTQKDNTGKVTLTAINVVSKDGKTLTVTNKDATGNVTLTMVLDKQ